MKGLYIGVLDEEIEITFKSDENVEEELLEGALVGLRFSNNSGFVNTQFNGQFSNWIFTHDGYIQPTGILIYITLRMFNIFKIILSNPNVTL